MSKPKDRPTIHPHTEGRWEVRDERGYTIYCGRLEVAEAIYAQRCAQPGLNPGALDRAIHVLS